MNKTKIEWVKNPDGTQGYTINPVKGLCPMHCKNLQGYEYCYAGGGRGLYKRFKWNPEIRYDPYAFKGLPSKPSRVFVGSTMELFGSWIDSDWWHMTMAKCLSRSHHTFIFLTKQPQNLPKKFPDNCWVGMTATDYESFYFGAVQYLPKVQAKVKFISFEPLLGWSKHIPGWITACLIDAGINWVIIGAQTGPYKPPKIEWVEEIVQAADRAGIPVFLKDNLSPLLCENCTYTKDKWALSKDKLFRGELWRQEMPQ